MRSNKEPTRPAASSTAYFCVSLFAVLLSTLGQTPDVSQAASIQWSDILAEVSEERVNGTIRDLQGFGSRAFYLQSSSLAAEYIYERFTAIGLSVEYQSFYAGQYVVKNVIAQTSGSTDDLGVFVFGAHYDSFNAQATSYSLGENLSAPGADDDASGVAAVIEMATVLAGREMPNKVKFVAFGAEELGFDYSGGLAGSSAFVNVEKWKGERIASAGVLDMIGYQDGVEKHTVLITNDESGLLPQEILSSVEDYGLDLSVDVVKNGSVSFSDHYPFWRAGIPCTLAFETDPALKMFPFNPYYHSSSDTIDHVSAGQVAEITKAFLVGLLELNISSERSDSMTLALTAILIASAAIAIYLLVVRKRRVSRT